MITKQEDNVGILLLSFEFVGPGLAARWYGDSSHGFFKLSKMGCAVFYILSILILRSSLIRGGNVFVLVCIVVVGLSPHRFLAPCPILSSRPQQVLR